MTIIAVKDRTMSADGRVCDSSGTITCDEFVKIRRLEDGRLVGCAGSPWDLDVMCRYLEGKEEVPIADLLWSKCEGLVLEQDGTATFVNNKGLCFNVPTPAAVGSGGDLALGAMLAGATSERAAEIACEKESGCGGRVVTLSLDE